MCGWFIKMIRRVDERERIDENLKKLLEEKK